MRRQATSRSEPARRADEPGVVPGSGAPVSVEYALQRLRILVAIVVAVRLLASQDTRGDVAWPVVVALTCWIPRDQRDLVALVGAVASGPNRTRDRPTRRRHRARAGGTRDASGRPRGRRLGHPRVARPRRRDALPALRRRRELGCRRRWIRRAERCPGRPARVERPRPAHDRGVPRGAAGRVPRPGPEDGDRRAPAPARRSRTARQRVARGRARRAQEHEPRCRRDPRRIARHDRPNGLRRSDGVRDPGGNEQSGPARQADPVFARRVGHPAWRPAPDGCGPGARRGRPDRVASRRRHGADERGEAPARRAGRPLPRCSLQSRSRTATTA